MPLSPHRQSEYTHMWKKNNDGQSLPRVGKVASGASRIGFWRYESERGDRLKYAVYESTLSTASLNTTPFPKEEGKEEAASPPKKEANPASLRSAAPSKGRGSRGHSLLPMEGGAPKGRRLDGDGGVKKSEEMCLKSTIYESTLSTAARFPFPKGKAKRRRLRRRKRKPTPPRCAR